LAYAASPSSQTSSSGATVSFQARDRVEHVVHRREVPVGQDVPVVEQMQVAREVPH
jgi:hypothetical protein